MSGLSVGQLEALSTTGSNSDRVMGDPSSSAKRAQRVIDVNDLVGCDDDVSMVPGEADSSPVANGIGAGAMVAVTPGTYLNNPVQDGSAWLHNQQLPSVLIKHAKVEHRVMLWYKAQGKSNRECGQLLGYSDAQVSQITRQPWFMADLRELLEDSGQDLIRKMLEGAAVDSIVELVSVRDNPKTPASVKVAACTQLLDRFLGKPKQEVTIEKKENPIKQVEKIDSELDELVEREKELQKQLSRFGKS